MKNSHVSARASSVEIITVGRRSREYLTEREIERLIEAARQDRWGHRDATVILIAYCHGLRASRATSRSCSRGCHTAGWASLPCSREPCSDFFEIVLPPLIRSAALRVSSQAHSDFSKMVILPLIG